MEASDSGAPTAEAVTWGKIKLGSKKVKVWGEASILFPILVCMSFTKWFVKLRKHNEKVKFDTLYVKNAKDIKDGDQLF